MRGHALHKKLGGGVVMTRAVCQGNMAMYQDMVSKPNIASKAKAQGGT